MKKLFALLLAVVLVLGLVGVLVLALVHVLVLVAHGFCPPEILVSG